MRRGLRGVDGKQIVEREMPAVRGVRGLSVCARPFGTRTSLWIANLPVCRIFIANVHTYFWGWPEAIKHPEKYVRLPAFHLSVTINHVTLSRRPRYHSLHATSHLTYKGNTVND